jgi:hypothetical protein
MGAGQREEGLGWDKAGSRSAEGEGDQRMSGGM